MSKTIREDIRNRNSLYLMLVRELARSDPEEAAWFFGLEEAQLHELVCMSVERVRALTAASRPLFAVTVPRRLDASNITVCVTLQNGRRYDQTPWKLAALGARPRIISALCGLDQGQAAALYREAQGHAPPGGMLPYDPEWIVRTPSNCLHASVFCSAFESVGKAVSDPARQLAGAYGIYEGEVREGVLAEVPAGRLDLNRAWHLAGQLKAGMIAVRDCERCKASYVVPAGQGGRGCPLCDARTDGKQRRFWIR